MYVCCCLQSCAMDKRRGTPIFAAASRQDLCCDRGRHANIGAGGVGMEQRGSTVVSGRQQGSTGVTWVRGVNGGQRMSTRVNGVNGCQRVSMGVNEGR